MAGRFERRIMRINDDLARLRQEERLLVEELNVHRHLHDDAARDAAVSDHPLDRSDAMDTGADVARFERTLAGLRTRIDRLEARRRTLLDRLE